VSSTANSVPAAAPAAIVMMDWNGSKPLDSRPRPSWAEKHYSPKELGIILGMSHDSIIRIFKDEPGVMKTCPPHRRGVRKRITYRIPESVVSRVYNRCKN